MGVVALHEQSGLVLEFLSSCTLVNELHRTVPLVTLGERLVGGIPMRESKFRSASGVDIRAGRENVAWRMHGRRSKDHALLRGNSDSSALAESKR